MEKNPDSANIDSKNLYNTPSEYRRIRKEFLSSIKQYAPGLYRQGQDLFKRISTRNWALEWGLPRWLGESFGLPEDTIHEFTLANVFLLGFVRIVDDVVDNDFQPSEKAIEWTTNENKTENYNTNERNEALLLGVMLQNLWQNCMLNIFCKASKKSIEISCNDLLPRYLKYEIQSLSEWIIATSNKERQSSADVFSFQKSQYLKIGNRFSLLKSCSVAMGLLAGRDREIPSMIQAIDYVLTTAVLMDDVFDWASDLRCERYNVFISFCSDLPQCNQYENQNETAVLRAIYVDDKLEAYFDLINQNLYDAERVLGTISSKFSKFISCLKYDVGACRISLKEMTQAKMKEAYNRFLSGDL